MRELVKIAAKTAANNMPSRLQASFFGATCGWIYGRAFSADGTHLESHPHWNTFFNAPFLLAAASLLIPAKMSPDFLHGVKNRLHPNIARGLPAFLLAAGTVLLHRNRLQNESVEHYNEKQAHDRSRFST